MNSVDQLRQKLRDRRDRRRETVFAIQVFLFGALATLPLIGLWGA